MAATGPIATFGAITAGAGYAPGTYPGVQLTGGNGSLALATLTVGGGGGVTAVALSSPTPHQTLERTGKNYQVGDSLGALPSFDGVGSGSGFAVAVATLAKACENCFFGKVVPLSAPAAVAGQRFCGNQAFLNAQRPLPAFQPNNLNTWLPNITADDYWCGDGADAVAFTSFSQGVTGLPISSAGFATGFVNPPNGVNSFTIPQDNRFNLLGLSRVFFTPANGVSATFANTHGIAFSIAFLAGTGAVGFQIFTADAANFTGAQSWDWLATQ